MELLTILNKLEPYMDRVTRHYKTKNTEAIIYSNTDNRTVTVNEENYTPKAVLLYRIQDYIELSIQVYSVQYPYKIPDINTLEVT